MKYITIGSTVSGQEMLKKILGIKRKIKFLGVRYSTNPRSIGSVGYFKEDERGQTTDEWIEVEKTTTSKTKLWRLLKQSKGYYIGRSTCTTTFYRKECGCRIFQTWKHSVAGKFSCNTCEGHYLTPDKLTIFYCEKHHKEKGCRRKLIEKGGKKIK